MDTTTYLNEIDNVKSCNKRIGTYAKNNFFQVTGVEISVGNLTKIVILPFNFEKTGISSLTFSLKFYISGNEDAQDRVFCIYGCHNTPIFHYFTLFIHF